MRDTLLVRLPSDVVDEAGAGRCIIDVRLQRRQQFPEFGRPLIALPLVKSQGLNLPEADRRLQRRQ